MRVGFRLLGLRFYVGFTWAPKVCRSIAFSAACKGVGLLFYVLLRFRSSLGIRV